MPFAGFKDFAACVAAQKSKGKSDLSARKICGTIQAKVEGARKRSSGLAEYQSSVYDSSGSLYLKYFIADDTLNLKGEGLDISNINDAIGKPWTKLIPKEESKYGDGHIWDLNPHATYEDHLKVAIDNSEGIIIDISDASETAIRSASGKQIKNGRFATIKVTDKEKAELYRDPANIPKFVSYGAVNLDDEDKPMMKNYRIVHLQQVADPAYGPKATLYGACHGEEISCMNMLRSAGIVSSTIGANWDTDYSSTTPELNIEWDFDSFKPVIRSAGFTSLFSDSQTDDNNMSSTETVRLKTLENNASANNANNAPVKASSNNEPPQEPNPAPQPQEGGEEEQKLSNKNDDIERDPDIATLKMQVREMREAAALDKKKAMIRSLIPREIFIIKGKFDEMAFEKEVDKMSTKPWEKEHYQDYYDSKRELLHMRNARESNAPYYQEFYQKQDNLGGVNPDQLTPENANITRSAGLADSDTTSSLGIQSLKSCLNMFRSSDQ